MLIAKKELNEWTHVILDEVHEREEDMDVVMLICKKLLLTNSRGTKLILMSATLDQSKFQSYFSSFHPERMMGPSRELDKAPIINLDARRDGIVQVKKVKTGKFVEHGLQYECPSIFKPIFCCTMSTCDYRCTTGTTWRN